MNIIIICRFPFPVGYSGTNRIISYSKGLIELGCKVKVLIIRRTENKNNIKNKNNKGVIEGIEYEYTSKSNIKSNSKFGKAVYLIKDFIASYIKIIKLANINPVDILLISSDLSYDVFLFSTLNNKKNIKKVFWIVDEYPPPIRYGRKSISFISSFLYKNSLKRLNGLISMTKVVRDFYRGICDYDFPSLIMPMTVEPERFIYSRNNQQNLKIITYIGNLEIYKDNIDILIESFSLFCKERNDYKLWLVGEGKDEHKLKQKVNQMGLSNYVVFKGSKSRNEIPEILAISSILVLTRVKTARSDGGFPTKLGEYLASGKPVILTNVGEINEYIIDRVNAFLVEPNNIKAFSNCLLYVANHYEEAIKVGLEGKKLAEGVFNYKTQAVRMYDFFLRG